MYQYRRVMFVSYIPLFVIEIVLLLLAILYTDISYVFRMLSIIFVSLILLITILGYIRKMLLQYELVDEGVKISINNREIMMLLYDNVETIVTKRYSFEFGIKQYGKLRTIYITRMLKGYKEFQETFITEVKKRKEILVQQI